MITSNRLRMSVVAISLLVMSVSGYTDAIAQKRPADIKRSSDIIDKPPPRWEECLADWMDAAGYTDNAASETLADAAEDTAGYDENEDIMWDKGHDLLNDINDIMAYYAEHPVNLNNATREQLEQLLFLTDRQVEDICTYIHRYGPMRTAGELQLIESLDLTTRRLLQCVTTVSETSGRTAPSLGELLRNGKVTLSATLKVPFYKRQGDDNGYLGYQYKHRFMLDFTSGDRLRAGLIGSQDAGEPFFTSGNGAGYDYYSFYAQLKHTSYFDNITIGRYRLSFGRGLVLGNSFSIGKAVTQFSHGRMGTSIRVHASSSEAGYFQGAAATLRQWHGLSLSAFASYRSFDATLNADGTASALVKTGYHRTVTEMGKKNNTHAAAAGLTAGFTHGPFSIGLAAVYTRLDRRLSPLTTKAFRRYYPTGDIFTNASACYGYTSHRFVIGGETAVSRNGAIATQNSMTINATDRLSLTLLHRHYSHRYVSLYAGSFSDGGNVRNESGACLSISWRPLQVFSITAYTDYARFVWPRYRISHPSHSSDNLISAIFTARRITIGARYRARFRQRDNTGGTALIAYNTHSMRLYTTYDAGGGWSIRTQGDMAITEYKVRDRGWMLTQNVGFTRKHIRLNGSAAIFSSDSYESRLYSFEHSTPYSFSCPSFYGRGLRYTLLAQANAGRRVMLTLRIGVTDYFDRNTIGSGYRMIRSSSAADLEMAGRLQL